MGRKPIDLTGKKFGRLKVIIRDHTDQNGHLMWLCKCGCGIEKIIEGNHLRSGHTKSCGCLQKESVSGRKKMLIPGLSNMRQLINDYKQSAKKRGYDYKLTEKQFAELTKKECHYCGAKPNGMVKNKKGHYGEYIYNGIDRVDNDKGYVIGNVVPCCKICNRAKNSLTIQEFKDWIKRVSNKIFSI